MCEHRGHEDALTIPGTVQIADVVATLRSLMGPNGVLALRRKLDMWIANEHK